MSSFILKIVAMFTMACDHISYVIFGRFSMLNYIGRIAFPIFAFQISEGYIHTSNLKKYLFRLLIFALISQIPFSLFTSLYFSKFSLNVFFTLFLGLLSITIFDKLKNLEYKSKLLHYLYIFIGICIFVFFCFLSNILNCDYGYYGVSIIFSFYLFKNHKILMNISFALLTILHYLKNLLYIPYFRIYLLIIIFTCLSLIFIDLYNNKKGKDIKYFLYLFYPIHLLIFSILEILT